MPTFNAVWEFFWIFLEITEKPLIALGIYYPTPPPSGPSLEETAVFFHKSSEKYGTFFFAPLFYPTESPDLIQNLVIVPDILFGSILLCSMERHKKGLKMYSKYVWFNRTLRMHFGPRFFGFNLLSIYLNSKVILSNQMKLKMHDFRILWNGWL